MRRGSPDLSIVIPVRNKAPVIERVLRAAADADLAEDRFELLVVDDGSTDGSAALSGAFAAGLSNMRRVPRKAGPPGAAGTRNSGIEAALGRWVLLVDADVVVHPRLYADCLDWAGRPEMVGLVPTSGSSTTEEIWPLLGPPPPQDPASLTGPAWLHVADARPELEGLRAPWAYFWTTAALVSRAMLEQVGGLDENLGSKGSEDIELGYRLHRAGAHMGIVPTAPVLHLPHRRDRTREEATDRAHEHHMLAKHRSFEVEMLCAFDASNTEAALRHLSAARPTDPFASLWGSLPAHGFDLGRSIAFFAHQPAMIDWIHPTVALDHTGRASGGGVEALFGLVLPFEASSFDTALVPDLRAGFPEALICRLFEEARRVAETVIYLRIEDGRERQALVSAETLAHFDRPYWERSLPVSRHYHDWVGEELTTFASADGDASCTMVRVAENRAERSAR